MCVCVYVHVYAYAYAYAYVYVYVHVHVHVHVYVYVYVYVFWNANGHPEGVLILRPCISLPVPRPLRLLVRFEGALLLKSRWVRSEKVAACQWLFLPEYGPCQAFKANRQSAEKWCGGSVFCVFTEVRELERIAGVSN